MGMPKIWKQKRGKGATGEVWRCDPVFGGVRYYLKAASRAELETKFLELKAGKVEAKPSGASFAEVALEFLKHKEASASAGAVRFYRHHITKPGGMLAHFEGRSFAEVAVADYHRYLDDRLTTPSRRGKPKEGEAPKFLSAQTVEHERAILVQIALFAEVRGMVPRAPITSRTLPRLKVPEAHPRMFTDSELAAVLEAADETMRPLLTLFLYTGLRLSEARRMEWSWIDLETRTLTVYGTGSKSKHTDAIPLMGAAVDVLRALPCKTGRVIAGNWGPILEGESAARIYAQLRKIARRAGVKRFGTHAFRHALGITTLRTTRSRHTTERMLRHRDPAQMDRYARLVPDEVREDLGPLEARLEQLEQQSSLAVRRLKKEKEAKG